MLRSSGNMLVLALATVAAYAPVWNAGFVWDDDAYVTENETLRDVEGLRRIWLQPGATPQYYPMVHTSFWIEFHLWEFAPRGFHTVNCLLHFLTSILFLKVLERLEFPAAWPAAFLFAIHPIQVESVAWITERKNVLSGVFYCLAALQFLQWRFPQAGRVVSPGSDTASGPSIAWFLSLIAFFLALLSKTTTCIFPAAALVIVWWKTGSVRRRDVIALAPFFVLGLAMGLVTVFMEKWRVGADGEEFLLSWSQRFLVASHALVFYFSKAVFPYPLMFIYPRWDFETIDLIDWLAPCVCMLTVVGLVWLTARGRRDLPAWAFLFAGSLFPALGFFNVYPMRYSFVADHFSYLAMMPGLAGLAYLLSVIPLRGSKRLGDEIFVGSWRISPAVLMIILICVPLTLRQSMMYRDLKTLWETTLDRNPGAWMAHHNLAILLEREEQLQGAMHHYVQAFTLKRDHVQAMNNAGLLQIKAGAFEDAERILRRAVGAKPEFELAWNNLGIALTRQGRLDEAVSAFDAAISLNPNYSNAVRNRAAVMKARSAGTP